MPVSTLIPHNKTWNLQQKLSSIRIAVIETNLRVSGQTCTVFHIMLEDDLNHFSLVRFIQDFKELDALLFKHFPKHRIPLPKLTEDYSKKSILNTFKKKKKSNSQLIETYLSKCLSSVIGRSSLFRDFLAAQRDEDRVISKVQVRQLVAQHEVSQNTVAIEPMASLKRKRSVCQQQKELPPSPPSSISITQFPDYHDRHDSGLTESVDDEMMCSSILPPEPATTTVDQDFYYDENEPIKDNNNDTINDYQLIKVLGKGATGKVILVREQTSHRLFALKAITKSWSITKREVEHIRMERDILASLSAIHHPFLIRLNSAFQDRQNLYLVLDYHAGADLATLLQRYIRFPAEQCRLYAAEIVMGLQELHRHCILYRDLKPENVLLAADGHIVLTDFGLSKMFTDSDNKYEHRTTTFCGTPEYLAPEIILQDEEYSYAADFWSLGTMLYEMMIGITPFAADTPEEMYDRVLYDDLLFPNKFDPEAMDLIAGLLERDPLNRLGAGFGGVFELRTHAYFANHLNWKDVHAKRIQPSYVPLRTSETDLSNFDPDFLGMSTHIKEETDEAIILRQRWLPDSCPHGLQEHAFRGYSYIAEDERDIPYESEISFFSSEYMMYDEDDDDDDMVFEPSLIDAVNTRVASDCGPPHKTLKSSRSMMMSPCSFNYNQNIRNSLVINSSVKDEDVSSWRS
ncbi:hypothetical protein MBANPS3_001976 [Mucor bainieri]